MTTRNRHVIAPNGHGHPSAYIDDPDGLVWLGTYRSVNEALAEYPDAVLVPALWDAPIIDPADPETYPEAQRRPTWP